MHDRAEMIIVQKGFARHKEISARLPAPSSLPVRLNFAVWQCTTRTLNIMVPIIIRLVFCVSSFPLVMITNERQKSSGQLAKIT